MSTFYSTKSLGRSWEPSAPKTPYSIPSHHTDRHHRPSRQKVWRYASWPLTASIPSPSPVRAATMPPGWAYENSVAFGANARQRRRRWERVVLCAFIVAVMFALGVVKRTEDDVLDRANGLVDEGSDALGPQGGTSLARHKGWEWQSLYRPLRMSIGGNERDHGKVEQETGRGDIADGKFAVDGMGTVSWSDFAYITHATDAEYLCASVMLLESLQLLGAKADRVLLYSDEWEPQLSSLPEPQDEHVNGESHLLAVARDHYGAKLVPVAASSLTTETGGSLTRLLAFNQTQYQRVLALDSDATIFQSMDELFLVPTSMVGEVAMPRAYETNLEPALLSTGLVLLSPSFSAFERIQRTHTVLTEVGGPGVDILNALYGTTAAVLPHRPYLLSSGEFHQDNHAAYLGLPSGDTKESEEAWDPESVLREAKYVHFSDSAAPKPWTSQAVIEQEAFKPKCKTVRILTDGQDQEWMDCRDRQVWEALYRDFGERRERVCGLHRAGASLEKLDTQVLLLEADVQPVLQQAT